LPSFFLLASGAKRVCPGDCPPNPFRKEKDQLITSSNSNASVIGWTLLPAECLVSGKDSFCFEDDGNVVLYSEGKPTWESGSGGWTPMQRSAELTLDNDSGALIATMETGTDFWRNIPVEQNAQGPGPYRALLKDGNLVVTAADGSVIWSTDVEPGEAQRQTCGSLEALGANYMT
jgi:hypothetical protein